MESGELSKPSQTKFVKNPQKYNQEYKYGQAGLHSDFFVRGWTLKLNKPKKIKPKRERRMRAILNVALAVVEGKTTMRRRGVVVQQVINLLEQKENISQ